MKTLTHAFFREWLETYGRASVENDARTSATLFAQDARYYETPFDEPINGREAIQEYWEKGARAFTDKDSNYVILAIEGNIGIARWRSEYTSVRSGDRFLLDCLFQVAFNEQGLCREFREWWHLKVIAL